MGHSLAILFALHVASHFTHVAVAFRPADKVELQEAVNQWLEDESMATARYGHIRLWDTSVVTDMSMLFENATLFNGEIGSWNTSQVRNMSHMFKNALAFNQPIGRWDTGHVTDMSWMFKTAGKFNQDIGSWNTSSLTNMSWMFENASRFNQKIGNWSTARVTNMFATFHLAHDFNEEVGSWNTERVTDMSWMFAEARSFNREVGRWDTGRVSDMSWMFAIASSFDQELRKWNTARVTNMSLMFYSAVSFDQEVGGWNTGNVTNMSWMFAMAEVFSQEIGSWNTARVADTSYMFLFAAAFNQPLGRWDMGRVTDMYGMFGFAASFNQDLSAWHTGSVRNMSHMFSQAHSFNHEIGSWNTGRVTNMSWMFESAYAFNQEIGTWNTANVTDMSFMFNTAKAFNRNISGWDVQSVTDMSRMFCDASTFSFLRLLKVSWPMEPAVCGSATRVSQEIFAVNVFNTSALPRMDMEQAAGSSSLWPWLFPSGALFALVLALLARRRSCLYIRDQSAQPDVEPAGRVDRPDLSEHLLLDGDAEDHDHEVCGEVSNGSQDPKFSCLSVTTVRTGQYIRVTTSEEVLHAACQDPRLPFHERCKCKGALGLVLQIDEVDYLAWVAFKMPRCQGWFPLACLQDAGKKHCPPDVISIVGLQPPGLDDFIKSEIIDLSEVVPSPASSMSSSTGLVIPSKAVAEGLPHATLDRSASLQGLPYLELNEQDQSTLLGRGTFGTTWVGKLHLVDQTMPKQVAVKLPNISEAGKRTFQEEANKLARVMLPGGVPHPYLIQLLAFVPEQCAIIMELCEGDLHWFRSPSKPGAAISVAEQVKLMELAGMGCAWIANQKLVHRDLKMQNILVAKRVDNGFKWQYIPKVADFGLAERSNSLTTSRAGTPSYMAPETQLGFFSEKSDVYSFGQVMLRTFCPETGYDLSTDVEVVARVSQAWKQAQVAEDAALCICRSLPSNPQQRPLFVNIVRILARLGILLDSARSS